MPSSPMSEDDLLAAVRDIAHLRGWRTYHTYDSRRSEPGFPDLVMAHPIQKRIVYVELKSAKGRVTNAQAQWLDDLHDAGAEAYIWRPDGLDDDTPYIWSLLAGPPEMP